MLNKELEVALEAVNSVRDVVLDIYNSRDMGVEIKEDNSPVTKADKAADEIIRKILSGAFPLYGMLTEETFDDKSRLEKDYVWIVDPIDGTKDFVAKDGEFTVNIGLSYKHEAVLGVIGIPYTGEIYYAVKGMGSFYLKNKDAEPVRLHVSDKDENLTVLVSRFHITDEEKAVIEKHNNKITTIKTVGACIKGCHIAHGLADITYRYNPNTKEWDTCAMQVIVEQAGGFLVKFNKEPIRYNREDVYNRDGYIIINKMKNFLI